MPSDSLRPSPPKASLRSLSPGKHIRRLSGILRPKMQIEDIKKYGDLAKYFKQHKDFPPLTDEQYDQLGALFWKRWQEHPEELEKAMRETDLPLEKIKADFGIKSDEDPRIRHSLSVPAHATTSRTSTSTTVESSTVSESSGSH